MAATWGAGPVSLGPGPSGSGTKTPRPAARGWRGRRWRTNRKLILWVSFYARPDKRDLVLARARIMVIPGRYLRRNRELAPKCIGIAMTGDELRKARVEIGRLWGLSRPIHAAELGRALRMARGDPGESIRAYEANRTKLVPGPVSVGVEMFLRGSLPPDGLPIAKPKAQRAHARRRRSAPVGGAGRSAPRLSERGLGSAACGPSE